MPVLPTSSFEENLCQLKISVFDVLVSVTISNLMQIYLTWLNVKIRYNFVFVSQNKNYIDVHWRIIEILQRTSLL